MRILYIMWECFGTEDIVQEFIDRGYEVDTYIIDIKKNVDMNLDYSEKLIRYLAEKNYDFVFSFNYFPSVSVACNACQIKYVSWVYDSPLGRMYSNTVHFTYNYVFIFDRAVYEDLWECGVRTIYYLPLAAAVERYDSYQIDELEREIYTTPISFVGSTYAENKHSFYRKIRELDAETQGYLDGIIQAQKRIYGKFILEDMLTPDIVKKLQGVLPRIVGENSLARIAWEYANFYLARQVTALERQDILEMLSERYPVVMYTNKKVLSLPKVENRGNAGYKREANYIYRCSKINLNITLKSIITGIPLRVFDILGSGGFLLSNYQEEYLDYFIPGTDLVYYENYEDLLEKVEYYLSHEKERSEIARNGYEKVKAFHTYKHRVDHILKIVFDENREGI